MTEEETALVFLELRRIGVDLAALETSLVGTGLRASELRAWLREIPDGAGITELTRRLAERAEAATSQVEFRRSKTAPASHDPRHRWWPTLQLLNAATDMLLEEWDAFGLRLAGADRETIAMIAFYFFEPLLAPNGAVDPITHVAEMIASAERDRLALKPSPQRHRLYLASRLMDLVDGYPVPARTAWADSEPRPVQILALGKDPTPPPLDPEGVCARCHTFGTVARLTIHATPPRTQRFCETCWIEVRPSEDGHQPPETAAEHIALLDRVDVGQSQPPRSTESRSWIDTVEFLELVTAHAGDKPDAPAAFAELATEIMEHEDRMLGPMPPAVAAFVQRYARPHADA